MSRFGRDYLQVGMYTEIMFPEHDVHFIAVNDGDSGPGVLLPGPLFVYLLHIPLFWNSRRFCFGIRAATPVISPFALFAGAAKERPGTSSSTRSQLVAII